MPASRVHLYTRPYAERGWCCVEAACEAGVSSAAVSSHGITAVPNRVVRITESGTTVVPCRGTRLSPAEMDEMLGKAFFTRKGDRELVAGLYRDFVTACNTAAQAYEDGVLDAQGYEV